MILIVAHVLFVNHISYSLTYIKTDVTGIESKTRVRNLNLHQYDSLINSLPDANFTKIKAISSTREYYYGVLPIGVLNIIYCIYIYYLVVLVIRTIIAIKRMKSPLRKIGGN